MPRRRSFMKRDIKLYNLIFPMWGIYFYAILFPYFFVLLLPANFIVDTVMLLLLFFLFKVPEKKELYQKGIWKAWGFGFLADFLAAGVLVILSSAVSLPFHIYAPLSSVGAFLFATVGVVLAGVLIYFFHIKFVWKGILLEEGKKKKIALGMAILTAPYLMYLSPL